MSIVETFSPAVVRLSGVSAVPELPVVETSDFAVIVEPVVIEPHPNADALELARVGDYRSVVRKGAFRTGDLVAYIPEQALLPQSLVVELGLVGRLAGPDKNRVKPIRLRGVLSQGICMPLRAGWTVGQDVTAELGVEKHEPVVPASMSGDVWAAGLDRTVVYPVPNIKRHPGAIADGELVSMTEKLHGTWCMFGWMPDGLVHPDHGRLVVSSKGFAGKGLALVADDESRAKNLYLRTAVALDIERRLAEVFGSPETPVFVLGEVFGAGVQDLGYGVRLTGSAPPGFRVFDIRVGGRTRGRWLDDIDLERAIAELGLERVPVLYRGPFDSEVLHEFTVGRESVSGHGLHVREGVVVRTLRERTFGSGRRALLKSINPAYLLRKGGTEFH
jgi:RNA ligase (TIGR02306 family)